VTLLLEDRLLTHTGKFQNQIYKERYSLYDLDVKYHPETIRTEEHPFYVQKKKSVWDNSIRRYRMRFEEPVGNRKELTKNDYLEW
jgi:hypothetical protein